MKQPQRDDGSITEDAGEMRNIVMIWQDLNP